MAPSRSFGAHNWRNSWAFTRNRIHFCGQNQAKLEQTFVDLGYNWILERQCPGCIIRVVFILCQISLESCGVGGNGYEGASVRRINKVKQLRQLVVFCSLNYKAVKSNEIVLVNANSTANVQCISDALLMGRP